MSTEVLIGIRMQVEAEDLIAFILRRDEEIKERNEEIKLRARRLAGLAEEQRRQARQERRQPTTR